ncbi:MAG: acylphosphatase [Sterolibacterium sp.]
MVKRLIISGRVQGVCYRYSMTREAETLGITGWVRNRRDGSVEATVAGNDAAIEAIIAWAHTGPPSAEVASVKVYDASGSFGCFEQWPTV